MASADVFDRAMQSWKRVCGLCMASLLHSLTTGDQRTTLVGDFSGVWSMSLASHIPRGCKCCSTIDISSDKQTLPTPFGDLLVVYKVLRGPKHIKRPVSSFVML